MIEEVWELAAVDFKDKDNLIKENADVFTVAAGNILFYNLSFSDVLKAAIIKAQDRLKNGYEIFDKETKMLKPTYEDKVKKLLNTNRNKFEITKTPKVINKEIANLMTEEEKNKFLKN